MNLSDVKNTIIKKYPQFSESKFTENTKGWSNYVVVVDDEYIFRFPRNEESYKALDKEKVLLAYFRDRTDVNVPNFEYVSDNDLLYNFVAYRLIKGNELSREVLNSLSRLEYKNIAMKIGSFLSSFHSLDISSPTLSSLTIHNNHYDWINFKQRVLSQAYDVLNKKEKEWISSIFDDYEHNLSSTNNRLSIIHGDFTEDHILIDENNLLSGVIDFGDVCIGDSAFDFAGLYISYGREFMELVLSNYKLNIDSNFMNRIEGFYIKQVHLHELLYGLEIEDNSKTQNSIKEIGKMMSGEE